MSEPEEQEKGRQLVCSSLVLSEGRVSSYPSLCTQHPIQTEQRCWFEWMEEREGGTNPMKGEQVCENKVVFLTII